MGSRRDDQRDGRALPGGAPQEQQEAAGAAQTAVCYAVCDLESEQLSPTPPTAMGGAIALLRFIANDPGIVNAMRTRGGGRYLTRSRPWS